MKVYIIRHGESTYNLEKKWSGWADTPLTDKGREDAKKAGAVLAPIAFDKVYSSDLSRAIETAKIARPNDEIEITPLVREVNFGSLSGVRSTIENEDFLRCFAERSYQSVGGESFEQFDARVASFLHMLEQSGAETVAVFAHGGVLSSMIRFLLGSDIPAQKIHRFNACVMVLDYNGTDWALHSLMNH